MRKILIVLSLAILTLAVAPRPVAAEMPTWKHALYLSLDRRVSFEFVDTPLSEAISFLQTLSGANMVLDPEAIDGGDTPLNLKVNNMTMFNALTWICRITELDFALQDGAIYVAPPQKMRRRSALRVYDVSDLTMVIQDFPGPEFNLGVSDPAAGAGAMINDVKEPAITAEDLADMIRRLIPANWGDQANVEVHGNKLIVATGGNGQAAGGNGAFVAKAKRRGPAYVALDARFVEVAESLLKKIESKTEAAEERAGLLLAAIKKGDDAKLSGAMTLTCKSGSSVRAMSGSMYAFDQEKTDKKATEFHGTRVDLHPVVDGESNSVALAVNLRRVEKLGQTARANAPVHEFTASLNCDFSDTVWLPGKKIRGKLGDRRLIALLTPTLTSAPPVEKPSARVTKKSKP